MGQKKNRPRYFVFYFLELKSVDRSWGFGRGLRERYSNKWGQGKSVTGKQSSEPQSIGGHTATKSDKSWLGPGSMT